MSIELRNVNYTYSKGMPFEIDGLTNVNIRIDIGEWVAVMGPTGSGKSTFLQHLNGLLKPDSGSVLLDGTDIRSSVQILKEARQKVGLVFQYPEHQLFGSTVYEEIKYGPENFGYSEDEIERTVKKVMDTVGLKYDKYKNRSPYQLSGGEKRRVALAGILATSPKVIALDEPTAGLDSAGRQLLIDTITGLNRELGITVIWVTHDIAEIAPLAHRLVIFNQGEIVLDGEIRKTLNDSLLDEMGLDIPVPVLVGRYLAAKGKPVDGYPVTIEEIKKELIKFVR